MLFNIFNMMTNTGSMIGLPHMKSYIVEIDPAMDMNIVQKVFEGHQTIGSVQIYDFKAVFIQSAEKPLFLLDHSFIKNIEEDLPVSINQKSYFLQENPPWNLDRVDQRTPQLDNRYFYRTSQGKDALVYVVDTGIDIAHPDFDGRAVWGINTSGDNQDKDCNSHGTHVAGTIGSMTYGIAKKSTLIAVKVLGCTGGGSMSGVIRGLEFVAADARDKRRPAIINMSLGGGRSDALNRAVSQLTSRGVHVVVAAGNESQDACNTSPASENTAMTVGATTRNNHLASFSNWGTCVDILSPGTEILSTVPGGKTAVLQGTSMASPLVAGVYALILTENPTFTPLTMQRVINQTCIRGVISGVRPDTLNCFIQSLV